MCLYFPILQCRQCTNSQIIQCLQNTALDLGRTGRDDNYGYGLIQGEKAYLCLVNNAKCCSRKIWKGLDWFRDIKRINSKGAKMQTLSTKRSTFIPCRRIVQWQVPHGTRPQNIAKTDRGKFNKCLPQNNLFHSLDHRVVKKKDLLVVGILYEPYKQKLLTTIYKQISIPQKYQRIEFTSFVTILSY